MWIIYILQLVVLSYFLFVLFGNNAKTNAKRVVNPQFNHFGKQASCFQTYVNQRPVYKHIIIPCIKYHI